jgi:hypothetical protein
METINKIPSDFESVRISVSWYRVEISAQHTWKWGKFFGALINVVTYGVPECDSLSTLYYPGVPGCYLFNS